VGRLQPGVSAAQAQAALQPAFLQAAYTAQPRPPKNWAQLAVSPVQGAQALNDPNPALNTEMLALMAMVGLVLLIACANVALLVLARNQARQGDFRTRLALGASAGRVARQLLTESAALVLVACGLGWWLAIELTAAVARWENLEISLAPDRSALAFTAAVAAAVAIAVSLAPLRRALRLRARLAPGSRVVRGGAGFGRLLAGAQIALSLALIANALLLVRSMRNVDHTVYGIRNPGLAVFDVSAPQDAPDGVFSRTQRTQFFQTLLQQLRATPGVQAATLLENRLGAGWSNNNGAVIDGVSPLGPNHFAAVRTNTVGADYFATLGQPLLAGRDFTDADVLAATQARALAAAARARNPKAALAPLPGVAVVNQTFVEKYMHGRSPLGHLLGSSTIVGLAQDAKYTSAQESARPMAWYPMSGGDTTMTVEVRMAGDAQTSLPALRSAMARIAPTLPLGQLTTQTAQWQESYADQSLQGRLALFFGLLAAVLVSTGLYGTLAYKVSQRTQEIGVRVALGATRARVIGMVLGESLWLALAGLALGVPLAWAGGRSIQSMLYHVPANDGASLALAAAGLLALALLAALAPAHRAAAVDPLIALRSD